MRQRYILDKETLELITIEEHNAKQRAKFAEAPSVMGDITPFRTIDGVEISSRSHLRAYEQANGVRQVGNDFNSHFGINKR
jgi:hypothetical protein